MNKRQIFKRFVRAAGNSIRAVVQTATRHKDVEIKYDCMEFQIRDKKK